MVKTTYSLDMETVRILEDMARRWGVSKSEALRRAIRTAAGKPSIAAHEGLQALDELQRSMRLTPEEARAWANETRRERRAASKRREPPA